MGVSIGITCQNGMFEHKELKVKTDVLSLFWELICYVSQCRVEIVLQNVLHS